MRLSSRVAQKGGFFLGAIVGLLLGLALALGVALYVTKVPVPFIDKVPGRTAEQDAAEAERNKNWDPNAALSGRNPVGPAAPASAPPAGAAPVPAGPPPGVVLPPPFEPGATATAPGSVRNPAAILGGASTPGPTDAFSYYVQVGAYARAEEAEAQRAKLAIQGFESKISEREQAGKVVYRVRVGPFSQRADAESAKSTLDGAGMESALVRVLK
jgi:cell division protein FtsN